MEDEQTGEQSDYLARGNYIVASLPREGTQHSHGADVLRTTDLCDDHSGPYHVRETEFRRGHACDLAKDVEPTDDPTDEGPVLARDELRRGRVEAAAGGKRRDDLGYGCS